MLISLSKKFVFVANLKTASTAIEKALRACSEVSLVESRFGKHQPYSQIESRFAWLLSLIDPRELLLFAVIRDPVDYMISLYNSHMDPKFKDDPNLYTGDLSFELFLTEWVARNQDQAKQQHTRFLDKTGRLATNYLISYENLYDGLRYVSERTGVKSLMSLSRENASYGDFEISSVKDEQREWVEAHFNRDREVLSKYCDQLLTSRPLIAADSSEDKGTGLVAKKNPATPDEAKK